MSFSDEARETFAHAEFEQRPDVAKRVSQLPLSQQEKAIAELHETINELAARLKPVLTVVNEVNKDGREEQADSAKSPLSQQLEANNRGIHRASKNIRGLMERLEC